MRFAGEEIMLSGDPSAAPQAPALLVTAVSIAPEHERYFNDWYKTEHFPTLAAIPGRLCGRLYRDGSGAAPRYVALQYLASPELPDSAAWKQAGNTPWSERLRTQFRDRMRFVCRRYCRAA